MKMPPRLHYRHIILIVTVFCGFSVIILWIPNFRIKKQPLVQYDHNLPLIWIGGIPRSGTTLLRVMLDVHPDIRCGPETRIIPKLLNQHAKMFKFRGEREKLLEANITETIAKNALGAYVLSIIDGHGEAAHRYCNKDPFTHTYMLTVHSIFPNSKFILMIRDGRAIVHSLITRSVKINGWDVRSYESALTSWNKAIRRMWTQCRKIPEKCKPVWYEKLVLNPEYEMRKILSFLGVNWDNSVLHHTETIGKPGGVVLAPHEPSTSQVKEAVHIKALSKWVGWIPRNTTKKLSKIAPMLELLGYDPYDVPNYRKLETPD